ncbi:uncharacterized protein ACNLHF_012647 [Anomaloglossus baeobatrachus]
MHFKVSPQFFISKSTDIGGFPDQEVRDTSKRVETTFIQSFLDLSKTTKYKCFNVKILSHHESESILEKSQITLKNNSNNLQAHQIVLMHVPDGEGTERVNHPSQDTRDQYRREYNPIPSSSSQGRKRRYVYYEQISFLAPILEVTQTEDNLDDSDEQPTAGPSATATSASEQEPGREDSENQEIQQDAAAATESHEGGTESAQTNTQGSSTQQTTTPATQSTQTNVLPRFAPQPLRARRIRRPEEMRSLPEIIDTRIIHIMNTLIPETDAERFCRSLSTSLTKIPSDRQERVRAAMLTLLSASQAEQEPVRVYEAIENWRTIMQQHTVPNTTDNQNTISTQTTMATVIVTNPVLQQSGQPSIASSTVFPTPIRQGYVATNTGALSTVQSATSHQPINYMNLQPTPSTSYFTQPTNIGGLPNMFPGSTYPQSFMMPHYPISTMLPTPHLQTTVNYPQGQQHTHTQYPLTHVDPQVYSTTGNVLGQTSMQQTVPHTTVVSNRNVVQQSTASIPENTISEATQNNILSNTQDTSLEDLVDL